MDSFNIADPELRKWVAGASPADLENALQVGWRNVEYFRKSKPPVVMSTGAAEIPVARGQIGEDLVENALRERFGDITNVTKTPRSGDITLWIGGRKTIIEVKNYTNPVPVAGVEKFRRDLSTTGAFAGVFVSLQSAITGVTPDFKIAMEAIDGRSVPCAYIVSCDRAQIVTSVLIATQLAAALVATTRDMYVGDSLAGTVRELATHVDELAGTRWNMQREVADAAERAVKNSACIMSTEVKLRADIEKLQGEVTVHIVHGSGTLAVAEVAGYEKLPAEVKTAVGVVVAAVDAIAGADIFGTWKVTARKCVHGSGIALLFSAKRAQALIPIGRAGPEIAPRLIMLLGAAYSWDQGHYIDISGDTVQVIGALVAGREV